jgi:hypothetical protein
MVKIKIELFLHKKIPLSLMANIRLQLLLQLKLKNQKNVSQRERYMKNCLIIFIKEKFLFHNKTNNSKLKRLWLISM